MKKLALVLPFLVLSILVAPVVVGVADAQTPPESGIVTSVTDGNNIGSSNGADTDTLVSLIINLINWFAWFVALAAVVMGLFSGILFITAAGDDEKITKAKDILLYSIVGIIVAVLAFSIVGIATSLVNTTGA